MYGCNQRLLAIKFFVCVSGNLHDGRVHVGGHPGYPSPWVTLAPAARNRASIWLAMSYLRLSTELRWLVVTSIVLSGCIFTEARLVEGLHQAFEVVAHGDYSVGAGIKRAYQAQGGVGIDGVFGLVGGSDGDIHCRVGVGILVLDVSHKFVERYHYFFFLRGMYAHYGMCCSGDGVAQVAAAYFAEHDIMLLRQAEEEACEQLVGVGASFVDIASGMSAA